MKLGSTRIDPLTGARGFVTRFIGDWAICRADDGSTFRVSLVKQPAKREPIRCLVRIHGVAKPFLGIFLRPGVARITQRDAVWYGCEVDSHEAELTAIGAA